MGNFSNKYPGCLGRSGHDTAISSVTNEHIPADIAFDVNFRIYWDGDLCEETQDYYNGKNTAVAIYKYGKGEIDRIYLNFSDPWPKDRHAKRRLPSREFLHRYDEILKKDGVVEFKTDNTDLFAFALEEVEPAGWHLDKVTHDLHNDPVMNEGNVMTEYEEKFSSMGNPICKYIVSR